MGEPNIHWVCVCCSTINDALNSDGQKCCRLCKYIPSAEKLKVNCGDERSSRGRSSARQRVKDVRNDKISEDSYGFDSDSSFSSVKTESIKKTLFSNYADKEKNQTANNETIKPPIKSNNTRIYSSDSSGPVEHGGDIFFDPSHNRSASPAPITNNSESKDTSIKSRLLGAISKSKKQLAQPKTDLVAQAYKRSMAGWSQNPNEIHNQYDTLLAKFQENKQNRSSSKYSSDNSHVHGYNSSSISKSDPFSVPITISIRGNRQPPPSISKPVAIRGSLNSLDISGSDDDSDEESIILSPKSSFNLSSSAISNGAFRTVDLSHATPSEQCSDDCSEGSGGMDTEEGEADGEYEEEEEDIPSVISLSLKTKRSSNSDKADGLKKSENKSNKGGGTEPRKKNSKKSNKLTIDTLLSNSGLSIAKKIPRPKISPRRSSLTSPTSTSKKPSSMSSSPSYADFANSINSFPLDKELIVLQPSPRSSRKQTQSSRKSSSSGNSSPSAPSSMSNKQRFMEIKKASSFSHTASSGHTNLINTKKRETGSAATAPLSSSLPSNLPSSYASSLAYATTNHKKRSHVVKSSHANMNMSSSSSISARNRGAKKSSGLKQAIDRSWDGSSFDLSDGGDHSNNHSFELGAQDTDDQTDEDSDNHSKPFKSKLKPRQMKLNNIVNIDTTEHNMHTNQYDDDEDEDDRVRHIFLPDDEDHDDSLLSSKYDDDDFGFGNTSQSDHQNASMNTSMSSITLLTSANNTYYNGADFDYRDEREIPSYLKKSSKMINNAKSQNSNRTMSMGRSDYLSKHTNDASKKVRHRRSSYSVDRNQSHSSALDMPNYCSLIECSNLNVGRLSKSERRGSSERRSSSEDHERLRSILNQGAVLKGASTQSQRQDLPSHTLPLRTPPTSTQTPSYQDLVTLAMGKEEASSRRRTPSQSRGSGSVDRAHVDRIRGASFSSGNGTMGRSRANSAAAASSTTLQSRFRAGSIGEKKDKDINDQTTSSRNNKQKCVPPDYKSLRASFDSMDPFADCFDDSRNERTPRRAVPTRTSSSVPRGSSSGLNGYTSSQRHRKDSFSSGEKKMQTASSAKQIISKTQRRRSENLGTKQTKTHVGGVLNAADTVHVRGPLYHHALDDIKPNDDEEEVRLEDARRRKRLVNGVSDETQSRHVTDSLRAALVGVLEPSAFEQAALR